jgi:hypothetical protein
MKQLMHFYSPEQNEGRQYQQRGYQPRQRSYRGRES